MNDSSRPTAIARYLRAVAGRPSEGPTDAELLTRFALSRDQGAFELLVWRHAGMVTAVCRSVLKDHHAAEDATQSAFLVLARKARTVRENPAGWLYRVARRIALRMANRRVVVPPATAEISRVESDDVTVLHDELANLPEKYRLPVLLCFFEGLSHADAAKRLGWPTGTVAGRIARAKDTLLSRLTRRGVVLPTTGITALCLADGIGGAFAETTTRAAIAFATGTTVTGVSSTTITMAKGAIQAMTLSKLQMAASVVLTCAVMTAGTVWAVGQGPGVGKVPPLSKAPGEVLPGKTSERIKVDPNAQPPGKSADPKRNADFAQRQRSKEKLKQIVLAIHNFEATYGYLPHDITDQDGKPILSWRVQLLPYMEQDPLYRRFKLDEAWDSANNKKLLEQMPDIYRIGIEPKDGVETYIQAFAGPGTAFNDPDKKIKINAISDGTSNTLGIAEVGPAVPWSKPADVNYHPTKAFPKVEWPFANVVQYAAMDGAYHNVTTDVSELALRRLIERDDGNPLPDMTTFRPFFPAESAEEKAMLARTLDANAALLAEQETLFQELLALEKLKNSLINDVDRARENTAQLKASIERMAPRIKKERDELGLRPGAKVPEPKELPKP